jgi:hypothetical protein
VPLFAAAQHLELLFQLLTLLDEFVRSGSIELEHFEVTRYDQLRVDVDCQLSRF